MKALVSEPQRLDTWLDGVTSFDGKPGRDLVKAKLFP
jgi:glycine betaine/proline transport system substrate-binding protein